MSLIKWNREPKMPPTPEQRARRLLMHIPVGIILVWIAVWRFPLGVMPAIAYILYFAFYEYAENKDIEDMSWPDVHGCIVGIPIGVATCAVSDSLWKTVDIFTLLANQLSRLT